MPALVTGSDVAMARWFSVSEFWDLVKKYEATHFKFIGTMLTALYNESKDPPQSNPARYGIGAPVPTEIHEEFENRFDVRLIEGYGLTETATTAAQNPIEAPKQGSFGTPHDHVRMTVVDEDDEPLPPGERGEIVVRPTAPWTMMSRYYGKPEATVEAWQNLWLHTGDIGYRDEEGYFYFVERKAHSIRRRGENISSAEVERILNHHPEVDESAVVGVTSELGEEDVKAYIVPRTDELSPEAVLDHLEGRLAYFKVPRYVEFTQEFPKTSTQRIEKYKLKQRGIGDAWDRREADYELER
jgi:acyl-CoA synthetase (AMP-forming)/AMP-acid ligase II